MAQRLWLPSMSRRQFLQASGLTFVAVACGANGGNGGNGGRAATPAAEDAPEVEFLEPSTALSGSLSILLWSHFVPQHDEWFDSFAKQWGQEVGVDVTVDHINVADIPARISSEISAGSGHDIMQNIAPIPQFEPSVVDLTDLTEEAARQYGEQVELCRISSFNPTTQKFFAYSHGWAPDPGDYRKSLWEAVGLPNGPSTWDELLEGGAEIMANQGVQMGLGMSQEIDSNMAGRGLLWSFGAAIQDAQENVIINSPETVEAVEFMARLFEQSMTQEVFAWNAASNNELLIAGQASYILNSISAYRTAQQANPEVADDIFFVKALEGPAEGVVAQHVMYNWIVPEFSPNVDAAKEFLLNYTHNQARATWESQLYDFPAFPERVPQLSEWLSNDPFGSNPPDKLSVLQDAESWSRNVGHQGPASTAIGEVFATFIIPNMFAAVARGDRSAQEAVEEAEAQIEPIFEKWRGEGLIGGA